MIVVYTLVATTHVLLVAQIAAIRRHVANLARVVIVQGLYGDRCRKASLAELAKREAAELLIVPREVDNSHWPYAPANVIDWLLQTVVVSQPEQHALILHADTFPVARFRADETIGDGKAAGAYNADKATHYEMNSNWLAIDVRKMNGRESILSVLSLAPVRKFPRLPATCLMLDPLPPDLRPIYPAYGPAFIHLNGSSVLRDDQILANYEPFGKAYGLPPAAVPIP